jgi:hypothetical protein
VSDQGGFSQGKPPVFLADDAMAEWVLYLDESGSTERHKIPLQHGQSPVFALGGVAFPVHLWRQYDRAYLRLKEQFFRSEIDSSSKHATNWEVKGNQLIAPRNKYCERNQVFVHKVMDLISENCGKTFCVSFLKNSVSPMPGRSMYTKSLQIIVERFDMHLRKLGQHGIVVIDSRMAHTTRGRGLDYAVAQSYLTFIFGNEQGRQLKRLLEAPLFADSGLTAGLQIADIVAALKYADTYQNSLTPDGVPEGLGYLDYQHVRRFRTQLDACEFKGGRKHDGRSWFGYRVIDHRPKREREGPDASQAAMT